MNQLWAQWVQFVATIGIAALVALKLVQPRPTHSNGLQFGCHAENLNRISDGNVAVSESCRAM
jgi:hypothetical protein